MDISALSAALSPALDTLKTPAVQPSADATERFNRVMGAADPEVGAPTGVHAALQAAFAAPADGAAPATLGSQILSGLQSTTGDFSQKWQGIAANLDRLGAQSSLSDMLRLQGELLQVSVQYELVGKAVARTTQNIDTLVRMS
ncbi:EscI/YscI/HrpB family type III secretion system inner rod protein [Bordetella genomosp. 1]|uniref:EscI/YscI/HrpB family type III secretion system inner rod protein n=1 Tax=Bordetella genomosp. 1 TaxID=1395607 RepID=A0A261S805_9BORD|nr:type III secretion system inner rod subunit SctI [Bordetella genomosp. 1]MDQ8033443.1 type III secretion system inner rod subunit SctI [Bordetella sp.]OZI33082.1 EscI/YscI/HrpB family type III secretion system inner rod protein [Bordetella genomosp. 1]OZI57187.1 EscI/YscI/HrpB family type III secretion system inner rod protein [Bordetella genomosp. 1]